MGILSEMLPRILRNIPRIILDILAKLPPGFLPGLLQKILLEVPSNCYSFGGASGCSSGFPSRRFSWNSRHLYGTSLRNYLWNSFRTPSRNPSRNVCGSCFSSSWLLRKVVHNFPLDFFENSFEMRYLSKVFFFYRFFSIHFSIKKIPT